MDLLRKNIRRHLSTRRHQRHEGVMRREADGLWRWETLSITSAWGWRALQYETVSDPVGLEHSPFGGRHVAYTPFES